jgi:CDP-paratose 2-epimerase
MPHRAFAFWRGASRLPLLFGEGGHFRRHLSVFGYKGRQVRDNIHSRDVVLAIEEFTANPRCGEVYNLGGDRENSVSMLEAIHNIEQMTERKLNWNYVEENRKGDHICYISDLTRSKSHHPNWKITIDLDEIFHQIIADHTQRLQNANAT